MGWMPIKAGLYVWSQFLSQHFPSSESTRGSRIGRPPEDPKRIFLGICYILGSGAPWRALPRTFGTKSTVHRYLQKWAEQGVFQKLWTDLLQNLQTKRGLNLKIQIIDTTQSMVVHIEFGKAVASAKYQGKRALKISLLVDQKGVPLSLQIDSAHIHDTNLLAPTLQSFKQHQLKGNAGRLLGDRGYVGKRQEKAAKNRGYRPLFQPRNYHRHRLNASEKKLLYRFRWVVERSISWLKNYRRLRFCYERTIPSFWGFSTLACCLVIAGKIKQLS